VAGRVVRASSCRWPAQACFWLERGCSYDYDVCRPMLAPTQSRITGKERDTETGLDYFGARYYGSNMGRFMSPDPLGGHLEDPQTLNRYVYVRNNPLNLTDPTGLDFYLTCKEQSSTCQSQTVGYDKNGNAQTALVQGAPIRTRASLRRKSGMTKTVTSSTRRRAPAHIARM
jgi:RHS repeat-associated protein